MRLGNRAAEGGGAVCLLLETATGSVDVSIAAAWAVSVAAATLSTRKVMVATTEASVDSSDESRV